MTKAELVAAIAEKTNLTKKDSEAVMTALFDAMVESLQKGDKVAIAGFGTFEVKTRAARNGINPRTKEPIPIPESRVPAFKAGKSLKDAVAK